MPSSLAIQHLLIRLRPLNRALRAAVERQAAGAALLDRPDLVPYCITDEQVAALLDRLDALPVPGITGATTLTPEEQVVEQQIRAQAAAEGIVLPLDELAGRIGLTDQEQQALLLCAAPELDRAYERVIAYILDDLNRRFPCVELLTLITAGSSLGGLADRGVLSRTGRLRLLGLLTPYGEAPTGLRQELRVPSDMVDYLLGNGGDLALLAHDPGAVPLPGAVAIPSQVGPAHLTRLAKSLRSGDLDLVGIWGSLRDGQREAVYALAQAADMPLRQHVGPDIEDTLNVAAALSAVVWLRTDGLELSSNLAALLTRSHTPVCLTGSEPWRPAPVITARNYAEIVMTSPCYSDRIAMWSRALPELDADATADLAARYRVSDEELLAIASLSRGDAYPDAVSGVSASRDDRTLQGAVTRAVSMVTCGPALGFVHAITPRRHPEDLVLPPAEHQMVLEIAAACREWPRIAEDWGFATHGNGGIKALFTGEPGTGKTLAAEVIAGMLGLTLLKVDLSQVVSKWVGETEKNLEAVFAHAESHQAVLFFDEADALFGKRGEIKHGTDRYANLEAGFLLQRLERSDAMVILASNLRENLDKAFTRRFHYIVHFPHPGAAERERIWRIAFPAEAPLAGNFDFTALAEIDMTGASIVEAARSAALLVAESSGDEISMTYVLMGISRQFQREARIFQADDLRGILSRKARNGCRS